MNLKNTEKKYLIIKNNNIGKKYIVGGILVTSLLLTYVGINSYERYIEKSGQEQYNYYSIAYIDSLNTMDRSQFDYNFVNIYKKGKYIINNKIYDINTVYIAKMEDGSVHIYRAGENDYDILTNQKIYGKKKVICCFRDSSIFFKLYYDGLFVDENIKIDNNTLQKYINEWDLTKHNEVPELKASNEADDKFEQKYGR